jgi:uncharacterized protein (TIGR03118 family)
MKKLTSVSALTLFLLAASAQLLSASSYSQTNLVSDVSGQAAFTDPNLKDPWGVSYSPTSPFWVSDRATGVSTLYNGLGAINSLVVTVPPGTAATGPTGQVFAGGTNFRLNGNPVNFAFATLGGTIDAWNGGTTATVMATTPGANYTGLALANNTLYAANFSNGGTVNAFNSSFAATTTVGNFNDPNLPAGYAPFNVQTIDGKLYVEFAKVTAGVPVAQPGGGGYVDIFDTSGNLLQRLVSSNKLDAPWGITLAPQGFGVFGGDLLIGNFGTGQINAFDPTSGNFIGTLTDSSGNPITNDGLWSLAFDLPNGAPGALNPNELYFTAGPNGGNDGLFGDIVADTPEPSTWAMAGLGVLGLCLAGRHHRKSTR